MCWKKLEVNLFLEEPYSQKDMIGDYEGYFL